jgi:hypothetical protein
MKLLPELAESIHDRAAMVLIVVGKELDARLFMAEHWGETVPRGARIVADAERSLMEQYRVRGAPYAVVVDEAGRVAAKGTAVTLDEYGYLLARADGALEPASGGEPGLQHRQPAPAGTGASA